MPRIVPWMCCVVVTGLWLATIAAGSSPKNSETSPVDDRPPIDTDFVLQGEYFGPVLGPGSQAENIGLQVVAQGSGQFAAVWLRGGLPGAGWDRQTSRALGGEHETGPLALQGVDEDALRIVVHDGQAQVLGAGGARLAQLQKIQRVSPSLGAPPRPGSVVLFDGSTPALLEGAELTADRFLKAGATTVFPVRDFQLHAEFRTPYMPSARGQSRGNSGIYIQRRYEVQILDSFGLEGVENECGGLYRQQRPDVNMSFPPLSWQTYDIWFSAARWDHAGRKTAQARITVLHNGVPIHLDRPILDKTGAGQPESPLDLPIHFQFHGDPVHFRNLWLVPGVSQTASSRPCRTQLSPESSLQLLIASLTIRPSSQLWSPCLEPSARFSGSTSAWLCPGPGESQAYASNPSPCRCSVHGSSDAGRLCEHEMAARPRQRRRAPRP